MLLIGLLVAAPAVAQDGRVWTNADLGNPLSLTRRTVTPEELASLAAHQFVYVPSAREGEPGVYIMGSSPTAGPFGEFAPFGPLEPLGGYTNAAPWGSAGYSGYGGGYGRRFHQRSTPPATVSDRRRFPPSMSAVPAPVHLRMAPPRAAGRSAFQAARKAGAQ